VDHRTPGPGASRSAEREPDPLVGELQRAHRDRRVLVVAAAVGIIAGAVIGMAFLLGALGDASHRPHEAFRGRVAMVCIVAPPIVSMAIGYAIFALRRRRR
jgi:hypothetical protein